MSVEIESLITIFDRIIADLETALNQDTPAIDVAFNRVLAGVESGEFGISQRHVLDRQKQCFPQFATGDFLTAWGQLMNEDREPATPAIYEAIATGTNGTVIEAGNLGPRWIHDNGILYYNKTSQTIVGGVATLTIEATIAGTIGNISVGSTMKIIAPQSGLDNIITVQALGSEGNEGQSESDYQTEIVRKVARPPRGGAPADYFDWGTDVPNFIDIYPYSANLPCKINIYGVVDDQPDGVPSSAQLTELETYISDATRLPLWAEDTLPNGDDRLNIFASSPTSFDIVITGLDPNSGTLQTAIKNALIDFFASRRPYIGGLSLVREGEITITKIISIIDSVIESLDGIGFASVTFALTSDPTTFLSSYTLGEGERSKTATGNISISG